MKKFSAPQIRASKFGANTGLQAPLNDALAELASNRGRRDEGSGIKVLAQVIVNAGNAVPSSAPWPLPIAQSVGTPVGLLLLRAENLTYVNADGVGTVPQSITGWYVDGQTIFVQFVSGLNINQQYRLTFGIVQ